MYMNILKAMECNMLLSLMHSVQFMLDAPSTENKILREHRLQIITRVVRQRMDATGSLL